MPRFFCRIFSADNILFFLSGFPFFGRKFSSNTVFSWWGCLFRYFFGRDFSSDIFWKGFFRVFLVDSFLSRFFLEHFFEFLGAIFFFFVIEIHLDFLGWRMSIFFCEGFCTEILWRCSFNFFWVEISWVQICFSEAILVEVFSQGFFVEHVFQRFVW